MAPLPLTLLLAQTPHPAPKPPMPEVVVALEDRSIALPRLPRTGGEGRSQFKEVHARVGIALGDLTVSLQALYRRPEARPLATDLSVPVDLAEEGRALVQVIDDPGYVDLERAYLDTWMALQAALQEGGVAPRRAQGRPVAREPRSTAFLEAKKKALSVLKAPARQHHAVTRAEAGYRDPEEDDTFSPAQLGAAPLQPEERSAASLEVTQTEVDTQNRMAATDLLLPDLTARWDALSEHLHASAARVLARQASASPTQDEAMAALRTHAQLAVLERFRKALYYCDLVWCQVAAATPFPPPPRLGPPR